MNENTVVLFPEQGFVTKTMTHEQFNVQASYFQNDLAIFFAKRGSFKINKVQSYLYASGQNIEAKYDYVKETPFEITRYLANLLGEGMGKMHVISQCRNYSGKKKNEDYSTMGDWTGVSALFPNEYTRRFDIFCSMTKPISNFMPKCMIHRDFKLQNILFDGMNYHLIDFDFAQHDYIGIEIGGMLVDLLATSMQKAAEFLAGYLRANPYLYKDVVRDIPNSYLRYLCTNAFPFYLHDQISKERFDSLAQDREWRLELLIKEYDQIKEMIEELLDA